MVRDAAEAGIAALQALYEAKATAELAEADALLPGADAVGSRGDVMPAVVLLLGEPPAADLSARRAFSGPSRDAAAKILAALGLDPASSLAVCTRPEAGADARARARRTEMLVEAADPAFVVALDLAAAEDLAAAFGLDPLVAGRPAVARGRAVGWVGDLAASLADESLKPGVWAAFKAIAGAAARS